MPAAPKQRKIAIVGSRSVGMAFITSCWLWICSGFGAKINVSALIADTLH